MYDNWEDLEKSIIGCKKCKLCNNRTNIVFADGNKNANVMLIGEGPGADEDKQGVPFVGKAGQLMNKAFEGLGIDRKKLYIANIVKCRPPNNRVPEEDEARACLDYLRNQVILVKPQIIVLMGSTALQNILGKEYKITASRGKWVEKKGILYMPTWHPAALLRDETKKIDTSNMYIEGSNDDLKVGDTINHDTLGIGVILSVDGSFIEVAFKIGIKKLMKNHKSIRKVG